MVARPHYRPVTERVGRLLVLGYGALVLMFLVLPILAVIPLSFNSSTFLSYPLAGFSLRWYRDFVESEKWLGALRNSISVATGTVLIATPLGTLAAFGLARGKFPLKRAVFAVIVSPIVVPVIIAAIAIYFVYARVGLVNSFLGLILCHVVLSVPFVVIVVHAAMQSFPENLLRAGASLGASPVRVFWRIVLPLIAPAVVSGALFAFMTSFDEVVTAIFLAGPAQRTLPLQMFDGVREEISPTITAVATLFIVASVACLVAIEFLQGRARRARSAKAQ